MLCQNAGLFGACRASLAACLEIHRAETGSISTVRLPVMDTRKKILGFTYRQKELPSGTTAHVVFKNATVLCYKKGTVFVGIFH